MRYFDPPVFAPLFECSKQLRGWCITRLCVMVGFLTPHFLHYFPFPHFHLDKPFHVLTISSVQCSLKNFISFYSEMFIIRIITLAIKLRSFRSDAGTDSFLSRNVFFSLPGHTSRFFTFLFQTPSAVFNLVFFRSLNLINR